jgi:hypothetical protein
VQAAWSTPLCDARGACCRKRVAVRCKLRENMRILLLNLCLSGRQNTLSTKANEHALLAVSNFVSKLPKNPYPIRSQKGSPLRCTLETALYRHDIGAEKSTSRIVFPTLTVCAHACKVADTTWHSWRLFVEYRAITEFCSTGACRYSIRRLSTYLSHLLL